jgi:hypothetical protein
MPLYGGSSGNSGTPLATCPAGLLTGTVNVQQNNYVWGGMAFAGDALIIASYTVYVYQSATGNVQCALYTAADGNIVTNSTSNTGSAAATGLLTMTLPVSLQLVKGTPYYLAIISSANGALFAAGTCGTFNNPPKPGWFAAGSGTFPSNLGTLNGSTQTVWIQGNT